MENFVRIKDLLQFKYRDDDGNELTSHARIERATFSKIQEVLVSVVITQINNVDDYIKGGDGDPVEKMFTGLKCPDQIYYWISANRRHYDKGE